MTVNPVVYFEIPVLDMQRAKAFYEAVFTVTLEPTRIDGNEMALFPWTEGRPGASGALACGDSYVPGAAGPRIYFGVENIAATLQRALDAGATPNYPITQVPGQGSVAEFIDTEGNCIALHSNGA